MHSISIETRTHGRALIKEPAAASSKGLLVGFHGYGQSAEDMMNDLERVRDADKWTIVSVQGLHRFYARREDRVVASWMTRQDRELAIADNIHYVNQVIAAVRAQDPAAVDAPLVFVGFSQGVAMAYRAAVAGAYRARLLIAVGGDAPPEVKSAPVERFPRILIAAGGSDPWYTPEKVAEDQASLSALGVRVQVFQYDGGHEWTPDLREHIHGVLSDLT